MHDATPVSTPACPSIDFSKAMCPTTAHDKNLMADVPYLEALGSLLYLAMCTRPDIAFAVSELAKFASNPGFVHWTGVKRIMRYLRGTLDYGLSYGTSIHGLYGSVDSSYARCLDTRRSRYGGILMLNDGPVDWKSKLQSIVALSSMEAEYIGACELVKVITWLRQCMVELGQDTTSSGPTTLYIDNLSAKMFADEYMIRNRSRHIDTQYHFIREKITQGLVSLVHQSTKDMAADILTKPLGKKLFERFRHLMGVRPLLHFTD